MSRWEESQRSRVRIALVVVGAAAFTAALGHLGYHYLRLSEGFARLMMQ
jgi:hypothetical protein